MIRFGSCKVRRMNRALESRQRVWNVYCINFSCGMVDLGLRRVSSSLGYFTPRTGLRPLTLPFAVFIGSPVTASWPHFKILQFSLKLKYFGTLKYDFRK